MSQPDCAAELQWLDESTTRGFKWLSADFERDGFCGYDAVGWDASIWIVNAMWETKTLPEGLSHDEVRRIERAAGVEEPQMLGSVDLNELLSEATLTGQRTGWSSSPGEGWERLRWSVMADRLGVELYRPNVPPCDLSFQISSWPINIEPPAAGSLDTEQFARLLDHLSAFSVDGYEARCFAYYSPLVAQEFDQKTVYQCDLGELRELWERDNFEDSPSNIWPRDRSWFVYTDCDLSGTKVSGSDDLISAIWQDDALEAVSLPF